MDNNFPLALPEGTILNGEYIIKRVLGQGGFGITYEAAVHKSDELVAIKEYLPDTMASRSQTSVTPYSGERGSNFAYGKQCFLEEAKTLANFIGNPAIVEVKKYFEENGTAYFVMEYIHGKSYKAYLEDKGGKIPVDEALNILMPVMDALAAVHATGIIHRDVTPDNIYITDSGQVKLLDFGAARFSLGDKSRSLDVVLKHGYAPKEQYTRHGRQGPYTDVYSLAVTIYRSITGRLIQDSIDRLEEDELVLPSALGVKITQAQENALIKALAVDYKDRYHSMGEFKAALLGQSYVPENTQVGGRSEIVFNGSANSTVQQTAMNVPANTVGQTAVGQTGTVQTGTVYTGTFQTAAGQTVAGQTAAGQTVAGQTAVQQTVAAGEQKKGANKNLVIGIAAATAVILTVIIVGTVLFLKKQEREAYSEATLPPPDAPAVSADSAPVNDSPEDVADSVASSDVKVDNNDYVNMNVIDPDSFSSGNAYNFSELGVSFTCATELQSEVKNDELHLIYNENGVRKLIYVLDYGKCGEVETYPDVLEELYNAADLNYLSDLIPLTIGNYPGWYVKYDQVIPPETYNQGVVFLLTPYVGVDRHMWTVFGEYDDVLQEIIYTMELEGAHKEDLSNVNTNNVFEIPHFGQEQSGSGYFIADSASRLLTQADIDDLMSRAEKAYQTEGYSGTLNQYKAMILCYARNEIFARHGRKFSSPELQDLFNSMDWYEPVYEPSQFDYKDLTDIEKKNVDFIKKQEESYGGYTPAK